MRASLKESRHIVQAVAEFWQEQTVEQMDQDESGAGSSIAPGRYLHVRRPEYGEGGFPDPDYDTSSVPGFDHLCLLSVLSLAAFVPSGSIVLHHQKPAAGQAEHHI